MCIIAKLLKLPFLLNCWERLYVKVTPILDGAYKPVSTTSPMYTLHRKWRFGKLNLHWHTLTVGMRRVVIWEAEDDFFRDLNGMEPQQPSVHTGPVSSSPRADLFGFWDHRCLCESLHALHIVQAIHWHLFEPYKKYMTCHHKTISSKNHSYFTLYKLFYTHFNKFM